MLSDRERQFLRGELDARPKDYKANLKTNIKKKLLKLHGDLPLIRGNKRLPQELVNDL